MSLHIPRTTYTPEASASQQMGSTLKHFPGYGNNTDTHEGVAHDTRSYETFTQSDFLPFEAGIAANASAVLVSHNIAECMDDQSPASLSHAVHSIIRNDLGFNGIMRREKREPIEKTLGNIITCGGSD